MEPHQNASDNVDKWIKEKKSIEDQVEIQTKELKEEQEKLLSSNRLMKGLLDNLPIGVFVMSAQGNPMIMNKIAKELSGRTFEREDGTPYPAEELPVNVTIKQEIPATRRDLIITKVDGKKVRLAMLSNPVFDAQGKLEMAIVVLLDITDEYFIDRAKTEFVSLASHQLRTPLSAMNWYSEMLLKGYADPLTKSQKNFVEEIYKSSQRMSDLVSTLLNVSRIELGSFAVEPVQYDVCKLINTITEELQLQITEKKITLVQNCKLTQPVVPLDPKLMGIVIENLLTNSIKYTAAGGIIKIGATSQKDGSVVLTVEDNGYGIPQSEQSKIFTKLYRGDNIKMLDTQGNGLGLYMIKSILNSSGCDIWFESAENNGTVFFVKIPKKGMTRKAGKKHLSGMQGMQS